MIASLKIYPNELKGGEWCVLYPEGFAKPDEVIDKPCAVKLFEMDTKSNTQEKPGTKDLIATFESVIRRSETTKLYYFDPESTRRTDTFNHTLPKEETRAGTDGKPLPVPLKYKPAHFLFALHFGGQRPAKSELHYISLAGNSDEVEGMMYEVAFSLEIGGKEILHSYKFQTFVDCSSILAENCANAAMFFKQNHEELIQRRGVGTHFGNRFPYYEQQTGAFDYSTDPNFSRQDFEQFKNKRSDHALEITSCIDFVKNSMELGFAKTGASADWKSIWGMVKNKRGDLLAKALVKNGWEAFYYNPDVHHPEDDAQPGTQDYKDATEHPFSYQNAIKKNEYYEITITGFIINYYPTTISNLQGFRKASAFHRGPKVITKQESIDRKILSKPFGFIIARGGQHTAMFLKGKVIEVHWEIGPWKSGRDLFELRNFVTEWPWNSGIIVFPKENI